MASLPYVILASQSPRRRELMSFVGARFEVRSANVKEEQLAGESPMDFVLRLAREKAQSVAASGLRGSGAVPADAVVLGADTEVAIDAASATSRAFGKPESDAHAEEMLRALSGRSHDVISGIAIVTASGDVLSEVVLTKVWFAELSDEEIMDYVASGEARDKAGAYGIQGRAARFIPRIEGCYYNVMGLPVAALYDLLRKVSL